MLSELTLEYEDGTRVEKWFLKANPKFIPKETILDIALIDHSNTRYQNTLIYVLLL